MKKREETPLEQTWDLTLIFESTAQFEETCQFLNDQVNQFVMQFEGNLNQADIIVEALNKYRSLLALIGKISAYTNLAVNANMLDVSATTRHAKSRQLISTVNSKLSFFMSELNLVNNDILEAVAKVDGNEQMITRLLKRKKHQLSAETERALASLSNTLEFPFTSYNETKFKDLSFEPIIVNGEEVQLTYNNFESEFDGHSDLKVRRMAFKSFSKTLKQYENTFAATYNAHVQHEKLMANLRGYDSVFDYLLDRQEVSIELYHRQIDVIMDKLAPIMRRYAKLLGKIHGIEKVAFEDLKLEIDPNFSPEISYEASKSVILDGLKPLGEDYLTIMKKAFDERWIDYAQSIGKRTGAFCNSPYGLNSFILMFFNNSMSDVATLAHELGHAGHFQLANANQNLFNARCSMYFVEAPSTTNELLVAQYQLQHAENDPKLQRYLIANIVGKTYYHNFVTHFIEAYYQREVYRRVDKGEHLTAATLNAIFKETLSQFWGEDVVLTEGAELTWTRQPHYFMGLYSYTYSAGLTIGTQVAKNIVEQGEQYANQWIEVLKAGGALSAEELALKAGVDVTTDAPLLNTIQYIDELVTQLEILTDSIN